MVRFSSVAMQTNGYDRGVYAIVNATALVYGRNHEQQVYIPHVMRGHLMNCLKKVIYIPFPPAQASVEESLLKEQRRYNFFVDVRCVIQEVCKCAVTIVIRNSTQSMSISTKATMSPHNTHVQNAKNNWHNNKYHIIPKSINRRMEHIEVFIFFIVMLSKFWTVAALLFQVLASFELFQHFCSGF